MSNTTWWGYVQSLIGDDAYSTAADRAGFDKSAFTRWARGAGAAPEFAVKLARAYGASPLPALVASGLLTEGEADTREVAVGTRDALRRASDADLLRELLRRVDDVGALAGQSGTGRR